MNRIFKVVFNKAKGVFTVASEIIKAHGGQSRSIKKSALVAALAGSLFGIATTAVADSTYTVTVGTGKEAVSQTLTSEEWPNPSYSFTANGMKSTYLLGAYNHGKETVYRGIKGLTAKGPLFQMWLSVFDIQAEKELRILDATQSMVSHSSIPPLRGGVKVECLNHPLQMVVLHCETA